MENESKTPNLKIYKAFIQAQGELKSVSKDAENPHFRSKYATLASTQETIRPILLKHGLAVMQLLKNGELKGYEITTILLHDSGETIETTLSLLIDKNSMQGLGSATTYAKRYALQALLGISAGDDDDDGNGAINKKPTHQQPRNHNPRGQAPRTPQQINQDETPPWKEYKKFAGPPTEFVMPVGSTKGIMLKDISLVTLESAKVWCKTQITKTPKPQNIALLVDLNEALKAVILLKTPTPPDNEPPMNEGMGMDDFAGPPADMDPKNYGEPESTMDVINEMQNKYGGQ